MTTLARQLPRFAPRDGQRLSQECFEATFVRDAAFDAQSPEKRKGRLARLIYSFDSVDVVGHNRRVYPATIADPAFEAMNIKCAKGEVYGRMDHPDPWENDAYMVTTRDAAVVIESVAREGEHGVKVTMCVCDNPQGRQMMSLMEAGGAPKISQRALALWELASDVDKAKYGVGEDTNIEIAKVLRLITFDVVAQPGFDQDEPVATEGQQPMTIKNFADLQTQYPAIATEALDAGKKLVDIAGACATAVEAAKPKIIEDAVKPLNTKIADLTATNEKQKTALEGVKPLLMAAGIAVEQVSDAEMKRRLDVANSEKSALEAKLATAEAALKTANEAAAKAVKEKGIADAKAAVTEKYGKTKFSSLILASCEGIDNPTAALEAAAKKVGELQAMRVSMGGKAEEILATESVADPKANSDGTGGEKKSGIGAAIMGAGLGVN